jgi:hypothetical protein
MYNKVIIKAAVIYINPNFNCNTAKIYITHNYFDFSQAFFMNFYFSISEFISFSVELI